MNTNAILAKNLLKSVFFQRGKKLSRVRNLLMSFLISKYFGRCFGSRFMKVDGREWIVLESTCHKVYGEF